MIGLRTVASSPKTTTRYADKCHTLASLPMETRRSKRHRAHQNAVVAADDASVA
jgi:hypothetical protein